MLFETSHLYDFLRSLILPLREIDHALPKKGQIYDLGCGEGVISKFLAKVKTREVIGIDSNKTRLQKSTLKNLNFMYRDIRTFNFKSADGVVISDVLHHLEFKDQKKVLYFVFQGLKKNGVMVVKEIDAGEFIRSKLSRFWDLVLYPNDKIYYQNSKNLRNFLNGLGFKVKIVRASRFFPGSTTLFICQKL